MNGGVLGGRVGGIDDDGPFRATALLAAAGLVSITASFPGGHICTHNVLSATCAERTHIYVLEHDTEKNEYSSNEECGLSKVIILSFAE